MARNTLGTNKQLGDSRKIQLRVSPRDEMILRHAAHVRAETLSEYIRKAGLIRSKQSFNGKGE